MTRPDLLLPSSRMVVGPSAANDFHGGETGFESERERDSDCKSASLRFFAFSVGGGVEGRLEARISAATAGSEWVAGSSSTASDGVASSTAPGWVVSWRFLLVVAVLSWTRKASWGGPGLSSWLSRAPSCCVTPSISINGNRAAVKNESAESSGCTNDHAVFKPQISDGLVEIMGKRRHGTGL